MVPLQADLNGEHDRESRGPRQRLTRKEEDDGQEYLESCHHGAALKEDWRVLGITLLSVPAHVAASPVGSEIE